MKKLLHTITALTVTLIALTFTSCFDPVFSEIMEDVSPEKATVSGPISSITRYSVDGVEYLFTTGSDNQNSENRGLRYKLLSENSHGCWKAYPLDKLPFTLHAYDYYGTQEHTGQQILKILADEKNLYLLTVEYENSSKEGTSCPKAAHLWQTTLSTSSDGTLSNSEWKDLAADKDYFPFYSKSNYYYSAFSAFCTNSPNPEHRYAYIRRGSASATVEDYTATTLYKLNGAEEPAEISVEAVDLAEGDAMNVQSAVYYPASEKAVDGVLFFNTLASITNETAEKAPSRFYYASTKKDGTLLYSDIDSSTILETGLNIDNIITLAINSDSIIIGKGSLYSTSGSSSGGLDKVDLDETGKPASEKGTFATNAKSQILDSYIVSCLLSADPSKAETDNAIYAAIEFVGTGSSTNVSFKNVGLWAYYTERGNWNRE